MFLPIIFKPIKTLKKLVLRSFRINSTNNQPLAFGKQLITEYTIEISDKPPSWNNPFPEQIPIVKLAPGACSKIYGTS